LRFDTAVFEDDDVIGAAQGCPAVGNDEKGRRRGEGRRKKEES
jgi:hypothetical protein